MSQATTWSVPLVGPATPTALTQRIDDSFDALLSSHAGSARPSYAVAGTVWQDTSVANTVRHYFYDGANDILLATVDTTNDRVDLPPQPFATVASAATTDIGAVKTRNVIITGTTTITSFGTAASGVIRKLRFSSPLTLTHNATSLILPNGGANIAISGGDVIEAVSLGGGNWVVMDWLVSNPPATNTLLAIYEDQKSAGVSGGANVAATWTTRTLNTEKYDPLNICSISGNAFTPTVNVIAEWSMPFTRCDSFQSRLFNVTDGAVTAWGTGGLTQNVGTDGNANSTGISPVLAAGKTYRLEYFGTTSSTAGLGWPANAGGTEVYTVLKLWRP